MQRFVLCLLVAFLMSTTPAGALFGQDASSRARSSAKSAEAEREHPAVAGPRLRTRALHSLSMPGTVSGAAGTDWWTTGTYVYDGSGNITQAGVDRYDYDSVGRLSNATMVWDGTTYEQSYAYDTFGNRISTTTTSSTPGTQTLDLPADVATNRLTAAYGFQYDASGFMTRDPLGTTYQYDSAGMLAKKGNEAVYIYTADDERIAVIDTRNATSQSWQWTLRDLSGKVVRTFASSGTGAAQSGFAWVEDHYHGGGQVMAADRPADQGGRRHFHVDHLGTTRMMTNGDGKRMTSHAYYPFGVEITSILQERALGFYREEPLRFTGHERDGLNDRTQEHALYLDYMHARYYKSHWGRFLTVDPGKDWEPLHPQSWNLYAYTRNDPLNNIDTDGRATKTAEQLAQFAETQVANPVVRMQPGMLIVNSMAAETLRAGDATGNAIGSGAGGWAVTKAVAKDAYTIISAATLVNGARRHAMGTARTTIIGTMDDVRAAAKSIKGANKMPYSDAEFAAMSQAKKTFEIVKFAAQAAWRMDNVVQKGTGGPGTALENATMTGVHAARVFAFVRQTEKTKDK